MTILNLGELVSWFLFSIIILRNFFKICRPEMPATLGRSPHSHPLKSASAIIYKEIPSTNEQKGLQFLLLKICQYAFKTMIFFR